MQQPSSPFSDDDEQRNDCFRRFDRRSVGAWDEDDCRRFVQQSLLVGSNIRASAAEALAREVFARFSEQHDGRIDAAAFERLWSRLVRPLLRPRAALVVVDVQNDFIGGSLAIGKCPARQEGSEVIPVINVMVRDVPFAVVAYSMDWHPPDHISFHDNLHLYELHEDHRTKKKDDIAVFDSVRFAGASLDQILWPKHCVQGSWGARLHEELVVKKEGAVVVKKGQERTVDSYSAFFDNARRGRTELEEELKQRGVSHLIVCGVALDFCVGYTCLDSLTLGFPTVLVRDAARGTDEKGISEMVAEIRSRHGVMADSKEVRNIVEGKDIREEFVRVLLAKESSA